MYLEYTEKLDTKSLLLDEVFDELFAIESDYEREQKRQELEDIADRYKMKQKFSRLYNAKARDWKKSLALTGQTYDEPTNYTNFTGQPFSLECGSWICNDKGISTLADKGEVFALTHPLMPVGVLVNAETGLCKVTLIYKIRGKWREIKVDKDVIASSNKIVQLASNGIRVTSENAKLLVKYLSDIEAFNEDEIVERVSTSRLGWIGETFMPYGSDIVFDNEENLKALFRSINQVGNRDEWYKVIKEVRQDQRLEILIYIAASLASVLVQPCGALPFIVDLWGDTGKGKTVALMIATSIWADPNEGQYMTDAKATTTAMEIRLNVLNSLPFMIDDMAQIKHQYDGDFSDLVYRWCAGQGRDRSNVNLGLNRKTEWHNCIITNAENSLVTTTMQGGAINRIIDVELGNGSLFKDGNYIAETMRHNYGFCGKEFVSIVQELGFEEIKRIQKGYFDQIRAKADELGTQKEDKQIMPMSLIMTADEIAEKYIFKDFIRLDFMQCFDLLKNQGEVSEQKRAYEYIRDTVISNRVKFFDKHQNVESIYVPEIWGLIEGDEVTLIGTKFDEIVKKAGFNSTAFLSWAAKNNICVCDSGRYRCIRKILGKRTRCVVLKLDFDVDDEEDANPFD